MQQDKASIMEQVKRVPPADVPDEIWLKVLSYLEPADLKHAAQVCKIWRDLVSRSETLWKTKCLSIPDPQLREEVLKEKRVENKRWIDAYRDNYGHRLLKRQWLSGKFSHFSSAIELPEKVFCPMEAHTWGEIFERELSRQNA